MVLQSALGRADRVFEFAARHYRHQFDLDTELRYVPRTKLEALEDFRNTSARDTPGELRLRKLEWLLEHGFQWSRFAFDRALHTEMVKAAAELVVGEEDWAVVGAKIAEARGWRYMRKMVCGKAARRFGKSVAMSKFVAAVCYVMLLMEGALKPGDNMTISTFSTTRPSLS